MGRHAKHKAGRNLASGVPGRRATEKANLRGCVPRFTTRGSNPVYGQTDAARGWRPARPLGSRSSPCGTQCCARRSPGCGPRFCPLARMLLGCAALLPACGRSTAAPAPARLQAVAIRATMPSYGPPAERGHRRAEPAEHAGQLRQPGPVGPLSRAHVRASDNTPANAITDAGATLGRACCLRSAAVAEPHHRLRLVPLRTRALAIGGV